MDSGPTCPLRALPPCKVNNMHAHDDCLMHTCMNQQTHHTVYDPQTQGMLRLATRHSLKKSNHAFHVKSMASSLPGFVRCWGTPVSSPTPLDVPQDLGPVVAVATRDLHKCAITATKAVRCWGRWSYANAGMPADLGPAASLALGETYSCALLESGLVRCWGELMYSGVPPDLGPVVALSARSAHTCALTASGAVRCWGWDNLRQSSGVPNTVPVAAVVAPGALYTCVLGVTGSVTCWGQTDFVPPLDLGAVVAISGGVYHVCAMTAAGALRCWGSAFLKVPRDLGAVTSVISAGWDHTCAIVASSNALRCWGNVQGIVRVPADLGPVTSVSVATYHACAVTAGK